MNGRHTTYRNETYRKFRVAAKSIFRGKSVGKKDLHEFLANAESLTGTENNQLDKNRILEVAMAMEHYNDSGEDLRKYLVRNRNANRADTFSLNEDAIEETEDERLRYFAKFISDESYVFKSFEYVDREEKEAA